MAAPIASAAINARRSPAYKARLFILSRRQRIPEKQFSQLTATRGSLRIGSGLQAGLFWTVSPLDVLYVFFVSVRFSAKTRPRMYIFFVSVRFFRSASSHRKPRMLPTRQNEKRKSSETESYRNEKNVHDECGFSRKSYRNEKKCTQHTRISPKIKPNPFLQKPRLHASVLKAREDRRHRAPNMAPKLFSSFGKLRLQYPIITLS